MSAEVFSITADRPEQETVPLMAVARESEVKNVGMREQNLLSLSYGQIVRKDINSADGLLPASFESYQIVDPGMTILRFTDLQNDQRSLRSGLVTERGIITSAYVAVDPFAMDPRFFAYMMRAYDTNKVFYGMGGGVRQGLNFDSIRRLPVPRLSADEQRAIADYLDQETAQIDALVGKQEEFIGLLRERRQDVIRIATGWGQLLPGGWRSMRLSHLFRSTGSGTTPANDDILGASDGDVSWVTTGELRERQIEATQKTISNSTLQTYSALKVYPAGTLLIAMYGATIGRTGLLGIPAATNQACCALVEPTGVLAEFVEYSLIAAREWLLLEASGGGQPNINQEKVRAFRIPVPQLSEQRAIVKQIDEQTSRIDALIAKAEEHIALAKERRSALITAAVTGQFDVRTARKAG